MAPFWPCSCEFTHFLAFISEHFLGPEPKSMLMCVNQSLGKVNDYQFLLLSIIQFVKTSVVPRKGNIKAQFQLSKGVCGPSIAETQSV